MRLISDVRLTEIPRMKYAIFFFAVSGALLFFGLSRQPAYTLLCWPALSFFVVALGYAGLGPRVFGKRSDGTLRPVHIFALLPFLLFTWGTWHMSRLLRREEPFNTLDDHIFLGRRLLSKELPHGVASILDLTSEFVEPKAVRESAQYLSRPILDATAPSVDEVLSIVDEVSRMAPPTYIHCAEGHGRTGIITAALLLRTKKASSVEHAIELVQDARPRARLNADQRGTLEYFKRMLESVDEAA